MNEGKCLECGEYVPERTRGLCDSCIIAGFVHMWIALADVVERRNREKGWYDAARSTGDTIALLHSEISEAYEGMRAPATPDQVRGFNPSDKIGAQGFNTVEEEFADEAIRLLDETNRRGLKIAEAIEAKLAFNATRSHRHGGKLV